MAVCCCVCCEGSSANRVSMARSAAAPSPRASQAAALASSAALRWRARRVRAPAKASSNAGASGSSRPSATGPRHSASAASWCAAAEPSAKRCVSSTTLGCKDSRSFWLTSSSPAPVSRRRASSRRKLRRALAASSPGHNASASRTRSAGPFERKPGDDGGGLQRRQRQHLARLLEHHRAEQAHRNFALDRRRWPCSAESRPAPAFSCSRGSRTAVYILLARTG